jgi:peptidyl-dipeptidase A
VIGEAKRFIKSHGEKLGKFETELNHIWWRLANNSKSPAAKKAIEIEMKVLNLYSDENSFNIVKKLLNKEEIKGEPFLFKQLKIIYEAFAKEQYPEDLRKQIVTISSNLENRFSEFRPEILKGENSIKISQGNVIKVLKTERNSKIRKQYWEAGKQLGKVLHDCKFLKLINLRNEAAKRAGYENFFNMSLSLSGQKPKYINDLFEKLDKLSSSPYKKLKTRLDKQLGEFYSIKPVDLMPWHYEDLFFQEVPRLITKNIDVFYRKDPISVTSQFYSGLGFDISNVMKNSDLKERKNKNPHAFCIDIDRNKDVRILASVKKNHSWLSTLLHEAAHSVYYLEIDSDLPYLLREPAHNFITEGVAMMMQQITYVPNWLKIALDIPGSMIEDIKDEFYSIRKMENLIFLRWGLVMYNFEKKLYEDPSANLQKLWWDLVEHYQLLNRPLKRENKFDWLTKIHLITNPVYYHNYILGQIFAAQLTNTITDKFYPLMNPMDLDFLGGARELGECTDKNKEIGDFLRKKIFSNGKKYDWSKLVEVATGKNLDIEPFSLMF